MKNPIDALANRWCKVPNSELDDCISNQQDMRGADSKGTFKFYVAKAVIIKGQDYVQIVCKDFKPNYVARFPFSNILRWFKTGFKFSPHVGSLLIFSRLTTCLLGHQKKYESMVQSRCAKGASFPNPQASQPLKNPQKHAQRTINLTRNARTAAAAHPEPTNKRGRSVQKFCNEKPECGSAGQYAGFLFTGEDGTAMF